jgi:acetoin utilization protein AcuC
VLENDEAMPRPAIFITHAALLRPGFGKHHPLSINRQTAVVDLARALGWLPEAEVASPLLPDRATLERFHDRHYLDALERVGTGGPATVEDRGSFNLGSLECPIFDGLWERARASVGGSILAARLALDGRLAFHPGGGTHHGRPDRASGFCYLNDPVFAILTFLDAGLERVLYLDLDAHHGDGVEDAFAQDNRVACVSIHEAGRWPGTGATEHRPGRLLNLPVPRGFNDRELGLVVAAAVAPFAAGFAPQAVVATVGADSLAGDPLSAMQLSNAAVIEAVMDLIALAPRAVVLGGGGYNPWTTVRLWVALWGTMSGRWAPASLPADAMRLLEAMQCDLVDEEDRRPEWTDRLRDPIAEACVRPDIKGLLTEIGLTPPAGLEA